jgi:hypothetical protein
MTFRLTTLLYLFALVAASLAAFGAWWPYATVGVMVTWGLLRLIPPRDQWSFRGPSWGQILIVLLAGILLAALILPSLIHGIPRGSPFREVRGQMRNLAMAIKDHEIDRQRLPFAGDYSKSVHPSVSWRVMVLPYAERRDVYDSYDGWKAWDHPKNVASVGSLEMPLYQSEPYQGGTDTHYFAIVGPETV